ncbi:MAG: hypothetical protein ABI581_12280 [Sediminibacterium sp.]
MQKIILLFITSFLTLCTFAQTIPEGIIFQALVKDPGGTPAKGRTIHIKDAIIQSTANGNIVYSETFIVQASADGILTITIGKGTHLSGAQKLTDIDWTAGPFFLNMQAAIEPSVPTPDWKEDQQYVDMGTSQFWSVPFAFTAAKVAGMELMLRAIDTAAMLAPYLRKTDTLSE